MTGFVHLHVHSHYSILDGMSKVQDIVDKCIKNKMYSVALTDHGVMFGVKEFHDYAGKVNGKVKGQIKEKEAIVADESKSEEERATARAEVVRLKKTIFKPIFGVEAYCARRTLHDKDPNFKVVNPETGREVVIDRSGWHLILLAKNKKGYANICKMVSISQSEGFYHKPRIDKQLLEQYHEGVICSSACLGGEIDQLLIKKDIEGAKRSVEWFKSIFGDDYYLEIMRHPCDPTSPAYDVWKRQQDINPLLVQLAKETNTKLICTNDSHFLDADHAEAHERLLCLSTGKVMTDINRMQYTKQEWLKTPDEMAELFSDLPETLENTVELAEKVESVNLNSDPLMPKFTIPDDFGTEEQYRAKYTEEDLFNEFTRNEKGEVVMERKDAEKKISRLGGYDKLYRIKLEADYLAKLAWEGAHKRYGEELTQQQIEQITFELHIMKTMGFPGYFLIVQDYIRAAREVLDVWVGPGRGSAAGSVVAYCLWITDVDPMKYDLLFERFLNPDRISLPDIDVDFADDGREKVLNWITDKYGADKVAHIITFGTMATKSSVQDVGRVQDVPLSTVKQITGYIPDKFTENEADPKTKKVPKVNLKNCFKYVPQLQSALNGPDENVSSMLRYAEELEGTVRQTGIHACGVIIGADDLTKFAPMAIVEDKASLEEAIRKAREFGEPLSPNAGKVQVTQYDGHYVESVGLIKMDFLGLITLSIMKEAVKNVKKHRGIDVDIFNVPIDDPEVYKLYADGKTVGIFQFESAGMQKYLKELQPTVFEDLIAMNALYRPGPMDYIPKFINRKQGREAITYDIPIMEKYLKDTYGVTVYQEQVMLLSRLLADFTRGESDVLRKAMGKKQIAVLNELRPKFINQAKANGHDEKALEKIWADWEKFASYAFNKSHATCYSWVSYQTAYLKTHYPAEYMAAMLTSCKDTIKEVSKYMDECVNLGLKVMGPDVNNSDLNFSVSSDGAVVFGLGGVKGVGESAVESIIREREENGPYKNIYDFFERVNLSACNRKAIESLAQSGAFDNLGDIHREQFFAVGTDGLTGSEILLRYGNNYQGDMKASVANLFGDVASVEIAKPELPTIYTPWSDFERLNKEKEVVGIYISSHPLASYSFVMKYMVNTPTSDLVDEKLPNLVGRNFVCAGIVSSIKTGLTKKGNKPFLVAKVEDLNGACDFPLFGNDYVSYAPFFTQNAFVCITGRIERSPYNDRVNRVITKVEFLSDVLKEGSVKSVTFRLALEAVTRSTIEMIRDACIENKEKYKYSGAEPVVPVKFQVFDLEKNRNLSLTSGMYSVALDNKLMRFVDNIGVELVVNT